MSSQEVPAGSSRSRAEPRASTVRSRRDEHVEDTRRALLRAARQAFAKKGYADTTLEDICGPARLTKGALYHHFASKTAVLEALYVELEDSLAKQVRKAAEAAGGDAWNRVVAALEAFFAGSSEPEYARIVLREAPHVLGGHHGRELDQAIALGLVCELMQSLHDEGMLPAIPIHATARVLLAATSELVLTMAEAEDPERARREGVEVVLALLAGLRALARQT